MLNGYCQFSLWQLVFQDYVKIAKKQQQQKQGQNKKAKEQKNNKQQFQKGNRKQETNAKEQRNCFKDKTKLKLFLVEK